MNKENTIEGFHTYRGYQELRREEFKLTPSMEDYLEMIYRICKKQSFVRISDLAKKLNVSPSSASKVVVKLTDMGLLTFEKYGIIQLTQKGSKIGAFLLKRHKTVETFFKNLGVKDDILRQTEMIEHYLSSDTIKKIGLLNKFFKKYPDIFLEFTLFLKNATKNE